jgi:hypothetical protein
MDDSGESFAGTRLGREVPVSSDSDGGLPGTVKTQAIDYVVSGVKGALGLVPFAGSLLAEIAGSIIPNQRVDRIADFAAQLETRIADLEKSTVVSQLNDEEFTDLVEEALRQASRATSEERRSYLASLVANSLTSEAIEHAESKHLMRLLGELNDVEVLWLRFYHEPAFDGDTEFRNLHADVFEPKSATMESSREELDDHTLQRSYQDHLLQLGLLQRRIKSDRDGVPEFDRSRSEFKTQGARTSPLGELLLRGIDMVESDSD